MDYRLEDLSTGDFEKLVNMLCQKVLGTGTVDFSPGKDGGRDGRFEGTANDYPSHAAPWRGKFIIQAKHTSDYNASCSDKDFFEYDKSVIRKEIPKIQKLKDNNEVDNYLLFTNRKETSKREETVSSLKREIGLSNVDIIGKETIHRWLSQHDDIVKVFRLGRYALPLTLTEYDIKNVIIKFGEHIKNVQHLPKITEERLQSISKEEKNRLNNLSQTYYDNQIRRKSLEYFRSIDTFLSEFKNEDHAQIYNNFSAELSNKIDIKRELFDKFEEVFAYLYDLIFEEDKTFFQQDRRLIWVFLHHMYSDCHIGIISSEESS